MDYLHNDYNLNHGQVIEVSLNRQANVILVDDINYTHYRHGRQFRYFGGLARYSPIRIVVPHSGHWHLVINLGGGSGTIRYSVNIL